MTLQIFLAALTMLPTFGYISLDAADNPSTKTVLALAAMLSGYEVSDDNMSDAERAKLFLWEMQRPGVLSNCVFLRMESAVEDATLGRDTAVLFLADLVDGTDSLTACDAAAVADAEAQLSALGLELPATGDLTTQSTFDVDSLLSEANSQRRRLQNAFERNNR